MSERCPFILLRGHKMRKKITIIHTTMATVQTIPPLIHQIFPEAFEIVNVMDDSLLNEIKDRGVLIKAVTERFIQYVLTAQNHGSDAVLVACSSIGDCATTARSILSIPVFKIDEPMAEEAAAKGNKILVLGTVKSTLDPTVRLVKSKLTGSQSVSERWIEGAFELCAIDKKKHDQMIAEVIEETISDVDVVVLAQASMAAAAKLVDHDQNKILKSLPGGLYQLGDLLKES